MSTTMDIEDRLDNMGTEGGLDVLRSLEERWRVNHDLSIQGVLQLVQQNLMENENETFEMVNERFKKVTLEIGKLHHHLVLSEACNDAINTRVNRLYEVIYYADLVSRGLLRVKVATTPGYTSDMNNDVGIAKFRQMDTENNNPFQHLLLFLLYKLGANNLRKTDNLVLKAVYTKEGHYTYAWEPVSTIQEWIHANVSKDYEYEQWLHLTSGKDMAKRCAEYLEEHDDYQFPRADRNRHAFAFRNGVYIANHEEDGVWCDRFFPYDGDELPHPSTIACKYTDVEFDDSPEPASTPHLDRIMKYQQFSDEEIDWLFVFLGRMLFDIGTRDGWQVMPFFKGQGGSGKSTIINSVCKNLYGGDDVKTISNNAERQFGLGSIYNSFIVIGPEIKRDFKLEQAEFQSMISGETMSVAIKHKPSVTVTWKPPIVFAGNEVPDWIDNSGSLQRRMVIFQFNQIVRDGDSTLGDKLKAEYPSILKRAVRNYIEKATLYGTKDVWNYLPESFKANRAAMAESTNSLVSFFNSEQVTLGKDAYCLRSDFVMALNMHCKDNGFTKPKWHVDYYSGPFAQYTVHDKVCRREWPIGGGVHKHRHFLLGVGLVQEDGEDENNDL